MYSDITVKLTRKEKRLLNTLRSITKLCDTANRHYRSTNIDLITEIKAIANLAIKAEDKSEG